jgi:antirestriction protein ArdC
MPSNALTRKPYRGINVINLWACGFGCASSRWATFKQWQQLGAQVRKGEKGSPVVFYRALQIEDRETGEEKSIPMMRYSSVFNADQVDDDPRCGEDHREPLPDGVTREQVADSTISATGARINYGGDRACYDRGRDEIAIPHWQAFANTEGFYSTVFHELTHWTGHKSRLDRNLAGRFGDAQYAMEELVAELGAAFTCAGLGIELEPRIDHANYIASWIKVLTDDKRALFTAAARASDAAEYIAAPAARAAEPVAA